MWSQLSLFCACCIQALIDVQIMWCQEEPMNMGAYSHCQPRLETCLRELGRPTTGRLLYAGRGPSAATATGFGEWHAKEMAQLLTDAMDLNFNTYMN